MKLCTSSTVAAIVVIRHGRIFQKRLTGKSLNFAASVIFLPDMTSLFFSGRLQILRPCNTILQVVSLARPLLKNFPGEVSAISFLPLDEAVDSRAVLVIVSVSGDISYPALFVTQMVFD